MHRQPYSEAADGVPQESSLTGLEKREEKSIGDDITQRQGKQDSFAPLFNSGCDMSVVELSKSGNDPKHWLHSPSRGILAMHQTGGFWRPLRDWRRSLMTAFLPVDFPNSVSHDYLAYQTYDSLQAFFSTITSLLASRALLQGLGVGDASTSATGAMLLTVLRDAISNLATIAFAHRFGLRIEPEAKMWRFLADLFNDTAFFLELCSPYLSFWGKAIAMCTGEALRAACGVAAGASKAALSLHFAKHDNLSELSAKEASQETAVGLVGLLVGTLAVRLVQDARAVACLVAMLMLAHLWTNYSGVRCVCMDSLNKQRASLLFRAYLETGHVCSPREVAAQERILAWPSRVGNSRGEPVAAIEFAQSYAHAAEGEGVVAVDGPMHTRMVRPYKSPSCPGRIRILLWDGAEPKHAVLAWFAAMETAWHVGGDAPYGNDGGAPGKEDLIDAHGGPSASNQRLWDLMAAQGWDLETGAMEGGPGVRLGVGLTRRKTE